MSNALEQASLIMVPSGYEDGTLGSLKPTDGTGDFTFTRGSNISATRVNADGYIEKGYENLLLQSNQFDTTWVKVSSTVTSGQAGYDNSNDAWLLEKSGAYGRLDQTAPFSGVQTFSVYAKLTNPTEANCLTLRVDIPNNIVQTNFNLETQVVDNNNGFGSIIEQVGDDGWYRCSTTYIGNSIVARIYVALNGQTNLTTGSLLIQDAMLNQGMVAYPYVETTTAPVAGGILEDMPRLDYSNGSCPSLLLEPSRTNLLPYTEYYNGWTQTGTTLTTNTTETLSPEGLYNASKLVGNGTSGVIKSGIAKTGSVAVSVYLKSVSGSVNVTFKDPYGGLSNQVKSVTTEWQRFDFIGDNGASFAGFWVDDIPTSGIYMWGAQLEQDATYPTSYIPTYGVSQTRLVDDLTSTPLSIDGLFGETSGTIFMEFTNPLQGLVNNWFSMTGSAAGGPAYMRVRGYWQMNMPGLTWSPTPNLGSLNNATKVSVKWGGGVAKLFIDGQEDAASTYTGGDINMNFTLSGINGSFNFAKNNANFKQILFFQDSLSDEACIELTTIS